MKLIALQNSSMEAQFANAQYIKFTGFLAAKVKEEGGGKPRQIY